MKINNKQHPAFFLQSNPEDQQRLVAQVKSGNANVRKYVLQINQIRSPQLNTLMGLQKYIPFFTNQMVTASGMTPEKAGAKIKSFLKQIDVKKVTAARSEIHNLKFKDAMRYHIERRTRLIFVRPKDSNNDPSQSAYYGMLVTGMIARVRNEDDVERILVGKGIDGFSIKPAPNQPEMRVTFVRESDYGDTTKVQKLSTSGAGREQVYTKFLTHLSHSQIAPIAVDAVDQRQVTDLQNMLTGTNAFNPGRALCWLKSFVFDPKKQVIFGDRNTRIADRQKHMQEFAARLKLGKC